MPPLEPLLQKRMRELCRGPSVAQDERGATAQALATLLAPRLLWQLETDVFHRRVWSWNRFKHWDRPVARMLLDTRPRHWDGLCKKTARDLDAEMLRYVPGELFDHACFAQAFQQGLKDETRKSLRTLEPEAVERLEAWVDDSLRHSRIVAAQGA